MTVYKQTGHTQHHRNNVKCHWVCILIQSRAIVNMQHQKFHCKFPRVGQVGRRGGMQVWALFGGETKPASGVEKVVGWPSLLVLLPPLSLPPSLYCRHYHHSYYHGISPMVAYIYRTSSTTTTIIITLATTTTHHCSFHHHPPSSLYFIIMSLLPPPYPHHRFCHHYFSHHLLHH